MSPAKALRRALSRTADVLWDLALVTQAVGIDTRDQDGVIAGLGPHDLLLLLDGPEGAVGLAAIDRAVMTGLVEVQTIQQVTQMPVDTDRVLTQTDAAMMAPLIDGALERMAANLEDHPLHPQIEGYRFGAMIEDARAAGLLLDAASYRVFRTEVDLALGRRRGPLTVVLPERPRRAGTASTDAADSAPHEELLARVPARLDVVLTRLTLPLNRARTLQPGDLLHLPQDTLGRVEITAGGGQMVARGRLGQMNGMRAVRLDWPAPKRAADPSERAGESEEAPPPEAPADPPKQDATPAQAESLPDLPPLDLPVTGAEFDFSGVHAATQAGLGGLDPAEDFSAASLDFDFEENFEE
ncbi:flagellar motor switch protein FliM [Pseudoponticoccus marisrubri]|uniref:Flagellar motor switch protein FliN-like C-terminal domain-containing protein n=1 Tax=Pseudoponticoccus marisrubri TaxID=1685382 RepID=A0A0W7WIU3_9RHOB|nr:FliM/FliN family flagellar motor C-terminal domain-containing protein [Pseudoponticoccus marisrubri]KUF10420.1 hypothetical protein AVJ23_12870 [Pseudoponticoccus marisrubri]